MILNKDVLINEAEQYENKNITELEVKIGIKMTERIILNEKDEMSTLA